MKQSDPAYFRWKRTRWTRLRLVKKLWMFCYAVAIANIGMLLFWLCGSF